MFLFISTQVTKCIGKKSIVTWKSNGVTMTYVSHSNFISSQKFQPQNTVNSAKLSTLEVSPLDPVIVYSPCIKYIYIIIKITYKSLIV